MNWIVKEGKLQNSYEFVDFKTAFLFMECVAKQAEKMQHHPDWENSYNKVIIRLCTHEKEGEITERDYALAEAITICYQTIITRLA